MATMEKKAAKVIQECQETEDVASKVKRDFQAYQARGEGLVLKECRESRVMKDCLAYQAEMVARVKLDFQVYLVQEEVKDLRDHQDFLGWMVRGEPRERKEAMEWMVTRARKELMDQLDQEDSLDQ